ncbi:raffinose/stachyose/melibiose transport system permease protein [Diaminobutyricimonas aerilata]|uniref:Raffinose/stachyose/melibiose transport system permease protein n=1 Tax=Diaminobutyricimonas aerilata TaxID=1162967 RepID=A0A2M9CKK3_9MICO|nr:carbohydrate ABC transporter permease [Diaminobutyricimonas aerilata]PJJ72431.1 raffinose/stachyose/melibiose transport system permease protein [Diaminobutyricimonas aerilata]
MTTPVWRRVALSVVMLALALVIGVPLYYVLVNSFKTQAEMVTSPLALPHQWTFDNWGDALGDTAIYQAFGNTLYVTVLGVLLQLFVGAMAAYAMLITHSRLARFAAAALLLGFMIPGQSTLIPLYRTLVGLSLVDDLNGLVLMYLGGSIFCFFLIQGYMRTIPYEVIEAARVDGAGTFQVFWRIVLPLIRPILVTVGVFQTMWVWNDFLLPTVFLSSPQKQTIVLQVYNAVSEFTTDWPAFMTITVIALIPMVVFFVFTQRHIVSGLLAGSVKG